VVILGSFDWHVKQENLRRFVSAADQRLGDAGIELVVGGRVPGDVQQEIERQVTATRFVGWLDDIAGFMASARIGVVSEPLGGGFKLKALDYVFHDVPVAALYSSATGLPLADGTSMIGAEDEQRLVTKIIASIDDGEALDGLATAARRSCEAVFSWEASANTLLSEVTAIG
jgi:glycosyltransferase involved in cell wall biosynthesis